MSESNDLSNHPNWCDRGDAVERLNQHFETSSGHSETLDKTRGGSPQDASLSFYKPLLITDSVDERLGETLETDVLELLHKQPDSGAAVVMMPETDNEDILPALCEAIRILFPGEPDKRFEFQLPFSWVPSLRRSIDECHKQDEMRYLLIDQFHRIFEAPAKEQRIFGRVIQQMAHLKQGRVIVGSNETTKNEVAELLGLISAPEPEESTPLSRYDIRREMEIVRVNTASYRKKRRAASAGVALAGCIIGAGLVAFLQGQANAKSERIPDRQLVAEATPTAVVTPINPQAKIELEGVEFAFPETKTDPEILDGKISVSETGPDPEVASLEAIAATSSGEIGQSKTEMLYYVAEAYCFGNGVDQDLETGLNYLNQAYNLGSGKAANLLGTCYSKGFGVVQSHERAFELYEDAVERGDIHAFGNLGVHHLRGWGCNVDADKAKEFFLRGAEKGDSVAALYLAKCLEKGVGNKGEPDPETARNWYVESAELGNPEAIAWCESNGAELSH